MHRVRREQRGIYILSLALGAGYALIVAVVMNVQTRETQYAYLALMIFCTIAFGSVLMAVYCVSYRHLQALARLLAQPDIQEITATVVSFDPALLEHDQLSFASLMVQARGTKRHDTLDRRLLIRDGHTLPQELTVAGAVLTARCVGDVVLEYQICNHGGQS